MTIAPTTPAGNPTTTPTPHSVPQGGDAKFFDPSTGSYNWQAHAVELQYKMDMSRGGAPVTPAAAPAPTAPVTAAPTPVAIDANSIAAEITSTGTLSDASRTALKATGMPDAMIDSYVSMAKATTEASTESAYEYLGGTRGKEVGKAEWDTISKWAAAHLTPAERGQYQELLNKDGWQAALGALKQRAMGQPGIVTGGVQTNAPAVEPFANLADQTRAINAPDPQNPKKRRYDTDPQYQREVQMRMVALRRQGNTK